MYTKHRHELRQARKACLLSGYNLRIDSKESILPPYAAWRASTVNLIPTRFLAPIDCSEILAQVSLNPLATTRKLTQSEQLLLLSQQAVTGKFRDP